MVGRVSSYLRENVLGLVAIFLALTAGAYAIEKAPKNSVVSKSIKDGQVKDPDLGAAAVTATKLAGGAVTGDKLADGVVSLGKLGFNPATQEELDAKVDQRFGTAATDTSGSTTPSVANRSILSISSPGPLTITDLTGAQPGQVVTLHQLNTGQPLTIADSGTFVLNGTWISTAGDTLTLARTAGDLWVEVARSVN